MAYDHGGFEALKPRPSGGRKRENITLREEEALLARFAKAAGIGEFTISRRPTKKPSGTKPARARSIIIFADRLRRIGAVAGRICECRDDPKEGRQYNKETPNNERFKAAFWEQPIPCRSRSISTPAVDTSWKHAFGVVRSHSIFPILSLGLLLAVIFAAGSSRPRLFMCRSLDPLRLSPSHTAAYLIQANSREGANESESRKEREDQMRGSADNEPDPDERIDDTKKTRCEGLAKKSARPLAKASLRSEGQILRTPG